jgi:TonB family protein
MLRIAITFATVACTACAASHTGRIRPYEQQALPDAVSDGFRACYESEASQTYLESVHREVIEAWAIASGARPHEVLVRLKLELSGEVSSLQVLESPNEALGSAAANAVLSTQPFEPVPPAASCLTTFPLRLRFETHQ